MVLPYGLLPRQTPSMLGTPHLPSIPLRPNPNSDRKEKLSTDFYHHAIAPSLLTSNAVNRKCLRFFFLQCFFCNSPLLLLVLRQIPSITILANPLHVSSYSACTSLQQQTLSSCSCSCSSSELWQIMSWQIRHAKLGFHWIRVARKQGFM
jgi:hypothetical protein